jgi:chromosome segregation ATPase
VVPKLYVSIQELLKKEAQLKVYLAQLQDISNTYEERITTLDAAFDKTEADVNALQKQAQTVLETHRLNMQHVKDTELANDRLEYELTDLEERVRELDMGGMEFDRKVAELNTALPEQDTTTKWTRTIMRLFT